MRRTRDGRGSVRRRSERDRRRPRNAYPSSAPAVFRMTSSTSKARPSITAPCASSTSDMTSRVTTNTRTRRILRGTRSGSRTPKGAPSSRFPPTCLQAARNVYSSAYCRSECPGCRFEPARPSEAGEGVSVSFASTAENATSSRNATTIVKPSSSARPQDLRTTTAPSPAPSAAAPTAGSARGATGAGRERPRPAHACHRPCRSAAPDPASGFARSSRSALVIPAAYPNAWPTHGRCPRTPGRRSVPGPRRVPAPRPMCGKGQECWDESVNAHQETPLTASRSRAPRRYRGPVHRGRAHRWQARRSQTRRCRAHRCRAHRRPPYRSPAHRNRRHPGPSAHRTPRQHRTPPRRRTRRPRPGSPVNATCGCAPRAPTAPRT